MGVGCADRQEGDRKGLADELPRYLGRQRRDTAADAPGVPDDLRRRPSLAPAPAAVARPDQDDLLRPLLGWAEGSGLQAGVAGRAAQANELARSRRTPAAPPVSS